MSRFGYRARSKGQFISAFEAGEVQDALTSTFKSTTDYTPAIGEQRSWNNSYAFLDLVLRDEAIPNNIEVTCELVLPADHGEKSFGRADIVLRGPREGNGRSRVTVLIELKQWDKFFVAACRNKKILNSEGQPIVLGDPVLQSAEYLRLYKSHHGDERVHACVFMHNLTEQEDIDLNVCSLEADVATVFHRGQIKEMREYLGGLFAGEGLPPRRAIARAVENGYWSENLPARPGELRSLLLESQYGLAEAITPDGYDYRPTEAGAKLGITTYEGFDTRRGESYVVCGFTDSAMRRVASLLSR